MTKKQAFQYLANKYYEIQDLVYSIETKYFQKKGAYHEDVTQDLYLKIYNELEKIEEKPEKVLRFLDRFYNGKTFNLYKVIRNMYIDQIRKDKFYIPLEETKFNENEKQQFIQKPEDFELEHAKTIEDKIDDYVETFVWFDKKLFNLFRYEFKNHVTKMSSETKLSKSTIYRTVKRCKIKINDKLKKQYNEK
tara:strand:+ start:290 stop:865 length:576 start_codon:yes stop_codon:yes gene_type:complete